MLQCGGQQKKRFSSLNYWIAINIECMGVTNRAHPAHQLLSVPPQPCGYGCLRAGPLAETQLYLGLTLPRPCWCVSHARLSSSCSATQTLGISAGKARSATSLIVAKHRHEPPVCPSPPHVSATQEQAEPYVILK